MHVAVIGAGAIGLTTAWYLREAGAQVTVHEMSEPANGASWGNAGQILPAKSVPLSEPDNLKYALKSFLKKNSPITAPRSLDLHLIKFLISFMRNSSEKRFFASSAEMLKLGRNTFAEFEYLETQGLDTTRKVSPFTSVFSRRESAVGMIKDFERIRPLVENLNLEFLDSATLHSREPLVEDVFSFGIQLNGQSFIDPPQFIANLSAALVKSGVEIKSNSHVINIESHGGIKKIFFQDGGSENYEAIVIATGAWLNRLTKNHGVKTPVIAGIGYSMSVEVPYQTQGMLYFPEARLATTNYKNRLRISTFMQMTDVETPRDSRRAAKLLESAKRVIPKADWSTVTDLWSGGRPLSGDGKPLIGQTQTPGVFVNAGHGMWGITLAPVSGKLITDEIISKKVVPEAFSPIRL